ncbi:unnamed protein product, partial [Hapterophycus canaliculatus]
YESCNGYRADIGDGHCDDQNNNAECRYDGGDCCECSCQSGEYQCLRHFDCLDPQLNTTECIMPASGCSLD